MSAPVVVAVDGTADGRRALRYGIDIDMAYDAPLRLVHVRHDNVLVAPMMPLFPDPSLDEIAARVLHVALDDARRMGWDGQEPETVLARAPRVPAIVDHSADARCPSGKGIGLWRPTRGRTTLRTCPAQLEHGSSRPPGDL